MRTRFCPLPLLAVMIVSTFLLQPSTLFAQGALTPPGAPAPLFKTLAQVEPRTPIASVPFVISQPGSYYLTTNLTGIAVSNGITILASDVTLDLMGFVLAGVIGSGDGIFVSGTRTNLAVRNGTVRGWGTDGVDTLNAVNSQLEGLRVSTNGGRGFVVGSGSTVNQCNVWGNGGNGIVATTGGTIRGCTAYDNGGIGISAGTGGKVDGCVAYDNGGIGISASIACTVDGCTAYNNGGAGIDASFDCTISGCTAYSNGGWGLTPASAAGSAVTPPGSTPPMGFSSPGAARSAIARRPSTPAMGLTLALAAR